MFNLREGRLRGTEWIALDLDMEKWLKSREAKDILEKLATAPQKTEEKPEDEDPVTALFTMRLKESRHKIEQLKDIISVRRELLVESTVQIDYQISKAATSLEEFSFFGVGYNTGVDMKRNHLERQLASFRRERREMRLKAWQDLASLRKELREVVTEYHEIVRRYRLFDYEVK